MNANAEPIRVLLIEDDAEDYFIAGKLLQGARDCTFNLQWAETLAAGISRLAEPFDAILLDLTLPDSQGWETFVTLRANGARAPVILLTGLADEALGVRAVQEGAEDYLLKGRIDAALLQRTLRYAIERNRTREELKRVAEELRARNEQLADDLHMARDVQQALVQRHYPSFPRGSGSNASLAFAHVYRPSRFVGGDFFHVLPLSDCLAGIFICDVMGHGVRSALVAAILRGLLEELKPVARNPVALLTELNRALIRILQLPGSLIFASAFYAALDACTGNLTYASAGHPIPLHLQRADGRIGDLPLDAQAIGPALGIRRQATFVSAVCTLAPGDVLVTFTDGAFEAENAASESFGRERLVAAIRRGLGLPVTDLLGQVVADLEQFTGGGEFEDDVCLLGIEMRQLAARTANTPKTSPGENA